MEAGLKWQYSPTYHEKNKEKKTGNQEKPEEDLEKERKRSGKGS